MRLNKIYYILLILSLSLGSCEKMLKPENDNHSTTARIYKEPAIAEGLLMSAYSRIPSNSLSESEAATDNAVINEKLEFISADGHR